MVPSAKAFFLPCFFFEWDGRFVSRHGSQNIVLTSLSYLSHENEANHLSWNFKCVCSFVVDFGAVAFPVDPVPSLSRSPKPSHFLILIAMFFSRANANYPPLPIPSLRKWNTRSHWLKVEIETNQRYSPLKQLSRKMQQSQPVSKCTHAASIYQSVRLNDRTNMYALRRLLKA